MNDCARYADVARRMVALQHSNNKNYGDKAVIDMPDRQMLVLARAQIETYGKAAAEKATERARALAEMGDSEGAEMWRRIAERVAREE